ncbi:zinc finger domain-containing protein [Streptomyces sp.]|uniref:zinc finger domain-containing protein n=1 Tax=Streptomyces sp. TaxID=1931 RepID=UPI002F94B1FD
MITFEEAGEILGLAAARDQRIVGDADILAWTSDLNAAGISYSDAAAALTRFYAVEMAGLEPDQRRRVTTPDVIGIARKIRAERLANFVYDPPPGDDDPNYLARRRGQLEATASGQAPALTERPALEGGPHTSVRLALAGMGRQVPDEDGEETPAEVVEIRRPGPLGVECPNCHAAIGRPCRVEIGGKRRELRKPHAARTRVANGGPAQLESQDEIERRRAASAARLASLTDEENAS